MSFAFLLFWLVPLLIGIWAFSTGKRDLHYPAIASWLFLAYLVPQAIYLEKSALGAYYETGFLYLYIAACFLASTLGFYWSKNRAEKKLKKRPSHKIVQFDRNRLTLAAFALILLGMFALNLSLRTAQAQSLGSEWTGIATAYYLVSQTAYFGIAIACLLFARKPSWILFGIILLGVIGVLPAVLHMVKRSIFFELALIGAASFFFVRRYSPPRVAVFAVMIFGTLLIHQVGSVRGYVKDERGTAFDAVMEGVLWQDFTYFELKKAPELTHAALDVYIARQTSTYEWGAEYWNKLTHQYVPSFILGSDFKDALKIETHSRAEEVVVQTFQSRGATRTGYSDSFRSFQHFGVAIFFIMGAVMGAFYARAERGFIVSQFFYVVLMNDALAGITESTARFISQVPFIAIVATGVFLFARKWPKKRRRRIPSAPYYHRPIVSTHTTPQAGA